MSFQYRGAAVDDAAAIDGIFRSSFCDTFAHLYDPKDLADFLSRFTEQAWQSELRDNAFSFRLAEADGRPVGYVKLAELKLPVETTMPALELRQLYIVQGYHGVGIAHALMDWALDEGRRRGAAELYLTVYVDNHRARRFYQGYGFEPVGRYEFMVGNHADEDLIMRKQL